MSFAVAQYQTARVETASPVRIVVQLYDGALRFIRRAQGAMEQKDVRAKGEALRRAHAIVSELQSTLDTSQAPELCAELDRLYEFVLHGLTQASFGSDPAELEPALDVLSQLREAWHELAKQQG